MSPSRLKFQEGLRFFRETARTYFYLRYVFTIENQKKRPFKGQKGQFGRIEGVRKVGVVTWVQGRRRNSGLNRQK